jgi:hypothetical protein
MAELEFILPDFRLVTIKSRGGVLTDYLADIFSAMGSGPRPISISIPRTSSHTKLQYLTSTDSFSSYPTNRFVIRTPDPSPNIVVKFESADGRLFAVKATGATRLGTCLDGIRLHVPSATGVSFRGHDLDSDLPFVDLGISKSEVLSIKESQTFQFAFPGKGGRVLLPIPSGLQSLSAVFDYLEAQGHPVASRRLSAGGRPLSDIRSFYASAGDVIVVEANAEVTVSFRYRLGLAATDRRLVSHTFPIGSTFADAKRFLRTLPPLGRFFLLPTVDRRPAEDDAPLTAGEVTAYIGLLVRIGDSTEAVWIFQDRRRQTVESLLAEYAEKHGAQDLSLAYSSDQEPIDPHTSLGDLEYREDDPLVLIGLDLQDYTFMYDKATFPVRCHAGATLLDAATHAGVTANLSEVVFDIDGIFVSPPGGPIGSYNVREIGVVISRTQALVFRAALGRQFSIGVQTTGLVSQALEAIQALPEFTDALDVQLHYEDRTLSPYESLVSAGDLTRDDWFVIATWKYRIVAAGKELTTLDFADDQTAEEATPIIARAVGEELVIKDAEPCDQICDIQLNGAIEVVLLRKLIKVMVRMPNGVVGTREVGEKVRVGQFLEAIGQSQYVLLADGTPLAATDSILTAAKGSGPLALGGSYRFAWYLWPDNRVRQIACDRKIGDVITELTRVVSDELIAQCRSKPVDKGSRLSEIGYTPNDVITIKRQRVVQFVVQQTEKALTVKAVDNVTIGQVKKALVPTLPNFKGSIVFESAKRGLLNDGDVVLEVVSPAEIVFIKEGPREYSLRNDITEKDSNVSLTPSETVGDLLSTIKRSPGEQLRLYVANPEEPLDESSLLADCIPLGAVVHVTEPPVECTVASETGSAVIMVDRMTTFKSVRRAIIDKLFPGGVVTESELAIIVADRELPDKDEECRIRSRCRAPIRLDVRIRDPRYVFQYIDDGKPKRKPVRIPRGKSVADVYFYWTSKMNCKVIMFSPAGRLDRTLTIPMIKLGIGEQLIDVRTKDFKYYFRLPETGKVISVRLPQTETVGQFIGQLRVGLTGQVPIRRSIRLQYRAEALGNDRTFFDLGIGESKTSVIDILPVEPEFTFKIGAEIVRLRLKPDLPLEEVESLVAERLGYAVFIDPRFRTSPVLRETSDVIDLVPGDAELVVDFATLVYEGPLPGGRSLYRGQRRDWVISPECDFPLGLQELLRLEHPCLLPVCRLRGDSPADWASGFCALGSLESVLAAPPAGWDCTTMNLVIISLLFGMRHIHSRGGIHRGLCPGAVFVDSDFRAKVGDFGTGRVGNCGGVTDDVPLGDAIYLAPELVAGRPHDATVDVFSFAVVAYEVVTGTKVFGSVGTIQELTRQHYENIRPLWPDVVAPAIRELLMLCWGPDPEQRPFFDDLIEKLMEFGFLFIEDEDIDGQVAVDFVTEIYGWEQMNASDALD